MRRSVLSVGFASLLVVGCSGSSSPPEGAGETADLVIVNGTVFTAEPGASPNAEAVAIRGNAILRVGTNAEITALAGPATETVDAHGGSVVPGFDDNHVHFVSASLGLDRVVLQDAETLADVAGTIREFAAAHPGQPWVLGRGWFYAPFPGGMPTRQQLDDAVPDRPAFMVAYDAHTGWANSKALELAGITRHTPNPPHGVVVKDPETGEPTGVLKEAAQALVSKVIPQPTRAETIDALRKGFKHVLQYGVTSIHNAYLNVEDFALYDELRKRGELTVRSYNALKIDPGFTEADADRFEAIRKTYGDSDPFFRTGAVKIVADGVIETHTAEMLEPYANQADRGLPNFSDEELTRIITLMDKRGWQIFTHGIGDGAIRATLNAYEHAAEVNPAPARGRRHRIEHVETIDAADIPRFATLGVIAAMHPFHANPSPNQLDVWAGNIGPERASRAWVWGSITKAGGRVSFGTDWAVVSVDPRFGLNMAVNRTTPKGEPAGGWLPGQKLSLADAIRDYTLHSAYAEFQEEHKGTLTPGKWADVVVFSKDLFALPSDKLFDAVVDVTIVDGKVVYRRAAAATTTAGGGE